MIDRHVAALGAALRGPAAARDTLLAEARAGLLDTRAAYVAAGWPDAEAEAQAVREFGRIGEVWPSFQEELNAVQARRTALAMLVCIPGTTMVWHVLYEVNPYQQWGAAPHLLLLSAFFLACAVFKSFVAGLAVGLNGGLAHRVGLGWRPPPLNVRVAAALAKSALPLYVVALVVLGLASWHALWWPPMWVAVAVTLVAARALMRSARRCAHLARAA